MRAKFILTLASIFISMSAFAQRGKFFSTDNQLLSSSFVTQVYLDNEGFLWATTRNGINRYDGYQFRVFKKENEKDRTLASNYVNNMMQDKKGIFYFGMYGALQTWDGNKFHNVTMLDKDGNQGHSFPNCFLERANGDVLVGTSGLGLMKFKDQKTACQEKGPLASIHTINSMIEDRMGVLWIVTDNMGLISYDGKKVKRYLKENPDLLFTCLCEGADGIVYAGTTNGGVFRMQNDSFVHINETGNNSVSALFCDHDGMIVIGYDGKGVALYDSRSKELINNPFFSLEVDLSNSKVYSITEDKSGNLWLGLLQKGIFMQPISFKGFNYMGHKLGARNILGTACVVSVVLDSKMRIWVGTDKDGLYCYDYHSKGAKHLNDQVPSVVMSLSEGTDGRIWVGSYREGIGWIDPVSFQYHRIPFPQDPHLIVMDIAIAGDGSLWLATMKHGVIHMDASDGHIIAQYKQKPGSEKDRKINSITNDYISQISISPDGKRIYCATTMGLCCLDIQSDSWTKALGINNLLYGTPIRIAKEYDGILWIGTNTAFWRYDLRGRKLENLEAGLPKNGIASIEKDLTGKLWISTDHGLCRLDPQSLQSETYFVDNGLQSNEFSDGASFLSPDGLLVFGGVGGISWFKPSEIMKRKWDAQVKITDFIINGKSVTPGSRSGHYQVCDTTVIASDKFELSSHDNYFVISLSTLTYDSPEHITFLYSINDEPYVRLQPGQNNITFSHLSPGKYVFKVKAERNEVSTPEHTFTIIVHSPWYRSRLATVLYLLLLAAALWAYLRYRRTREQEKLRMQEHIHAEEMGEAKLRFFMNISHEIRTPMTLIITPLLGLIKQEHDPQKKGVLETMRRNAERILNLINQMMDLRKIDKGMMQLHTQQTDLIKFVYDIHSLFELQTRAKRINLTYEHDTDHLPVWIDRQQFDKVLVNILSNAFKFTPADGNIKVKVTHDEQQARISISNDGEQIPSDKLELIFKRFYQTPSNLNDRNVGTGIGLDLTRSLVEMHHGTIKAQNIENGCEFIVTIPLGNSHFKPEEISEETETPDTEVITPEEADSLMQPVEIPLKSNQQTTIVIAEDDDEIRQYLEQELSQKYEVKCCSNGRDALAMVLKCSPDLLLSDIMMPEMDGNTLCSTVKSNPQTNDIPVVLLTAKTREEDKLEGLETGADAYIEKPFNLDILLRTIHNLIQSRQHLRMKYGRTDKMEEHVESVSIKSPDEKLLERVMQVINKNISNSSLSVDSLADEVGISRVHLHRKMKELTGKTPHEIIRNIRLKQAANLLASGDMNITEVVYACGFGNAASFSTIFKRFYGMSPRDYMQEHLEQE